jgi:hypothetical protein
MADMALTPVNRSELSLKMISLVLPETMPNEQINWRWAFYSWFKQLRPGSDKISIELRAENN